jgi:4-amino-4-deoxy-L-arabinose transferase-like glycosyltransferase
MSHPTPSPSTVNRRVELMLLVAILLVAALLRFHQIDSVPPGPSHDELRMMDLGELIVEGARPIHWTVSYSAEPFYMYLLALTMPVWGFTPFGARIVTRFAGLLLIPLVHRLTRRFFDRRVALITSGLLAVTWWPLFFSRIALRGITLPLFFTASVYCLWRGFNLEDRETVDWKWLIVGSALMGFTWYTFTAARGLVILLPLILIHLAWSGRIHGEQLWRVSLVTIGMAVLVIAPFVYDMRVNPGAPEARLGQLNEVINALKSGNPLPFARQTINTMGLFLWRGDPNWRYNVSGRPAFGPLLGALAVLGFLMSIVRWRQPSYFTLVAWLLLGLAPSMLTPEAPSFVRGIGALPAAVIMPSIGAVVLWDWLASRVGSMVKRIIPALLLIIVVINGLFTFRAQFIHWPIQPEVREIYQASLTEAFRALNHGNLEGPLWISEPFPDDRHLLLSKRLLRRKEIKLRWFDSSKALILPPTQGVRRYLLADFANPDPVLFNRWMSEATIISEGEVPTLQEKPSFRIYEIAGGAWVEKKLSQITADSTAFADQTMQQMVSLPARFDEAATLLGYELKDSNLAPGDNVHLIVYWRVPGPAYEPLASFAHLLDERHNIVGQYDGFDVPPWHWEPEAVIAQVYRFPVDQNAQPGFHKLQVGLYNSQTMERILIIDDTGTTIGDRLLLREITVR